MILDTLKEKALESAKKYNLTLQDYQIGNPFTIIQIIDLQGNTSIGVALSPHNETQKLLCKDFSNIQEILELNDYNLATRVIILALINAIGQYELLNKNLNLNSNLREALFDFLITHSKSQDHIVFIGHLKPVVQKLKTQRANVSVFCRSMQDESNQVYNDIFEYEAVSKADIVVITGSSLIGSTIDALLKFTAHAKYVILAGFSAGFDPIWIQNYGITHVASIFLKDSSKEQIIQSNLEDIFNNSCYIIPTA